MRNTNDIFIFVCCCQSGNTLPNAWIEDQNITTPQTHRSIIFEDKVLAYFAIYFVLICLFINIFSTENPSIDKVKYAVKSLILMVTAQSDATDGFGRIKYVGNRPTFIEID